MSFNLSNSVFFCPKPRLAELGVTQVSKNRSPLVLLKKKSAGAWRFHDLYWIGLGQERSDRASDQCTKEEVS